ncbi:hypothetical protein RN001_000445 [Aquatica leii]|uniref:Uncharacterized protein n=1 Tax=Aquatica leii TaxID=1421715 RepID=A0AAN7SKK0_9COLE|nr:hypothetical protein RN001_000445 [Aquatica leii]
MEWFGLTTYGYPDSIKYLMREDYKEPTKQLTVYEELAKGSKKRFSELVTEIDVYLGRTDGYSHKSLDRLKKMRRKGVVAPLGPTDKYRYAGTEAQNFSFWKEDSVLQNSDWYKGRVYKPKVATEVSQYLHKAKQVDKHFKM